ncbi:MAG: HEAT repeat domain-containing protein [Pyrinomonadaceae bacterium]
MERAITALRHVRPDSFKTEQAQAAKAKEIDAAWETISKAGPVGTARLKEEVRRVESAGARDDYFKLNASALLWEIGKLDEARNIAAIWRTTPLTANYNYVFYPSVEAARTQDARALPMLEAILRDDKGKVFFAQHAMDVEWPLTHEFIWGSYGARGLPRLAEIIRTTQDPVTIESAIVLLAQAQYLEALPTLRELAHNGTGDARLTAIRALGVYGHPQDYDFLLAGLRANDPKAQTVSAFALYEYEDLRAVAQLLPLLSAKDEALRREVFAALTHLLTAEGVDAIYQYAKTAPTQAEREEALTHLNEELKEYQLSLNTYLNLPPTARVQAIENMRQRREAGRFALGQGERGYTHAELLTAAAEWKQKHRLESKNQALAPVEPKHILTGATVNDIALLLDVKAALYPRLSDECLYEVRRLDEVVRRLGRSRYRGAVGITAKVEAH